ncbi:hypothetical protein ILUMI_16241, partial [Ignelater luminosus]
MPLPAAPTCNKIRIRPVFDDSARDHTNRNFVCLNQCLEKYPNLIEKIPAILARFRMNRLGQALVECKSGACVRDLSMDLVEQLKGNFYVENCVTSLDTQADCLEFMELAKSIMWERKFDLGGWEFNTNYEVPPSNVLGLLWDRKTNTFKINVRNLSSIKLGTLTWEEGTTWDQEVDPEISARFMTWMEEIRLLSGVKIVKISRWLPGCTESK